MAQPSVAREPSMEEILASIRRIIESNEPSPSGSFAGKLPPVYDDESDDDFGLAFTQAGHGAVNSSPERRGEMASPPPHVPPAANQTHGAAQSAPEKAMSLADVAARVRAATGRTLEPALSAITAEALETKPEVKNVAAHAAYESPVMAARMADLRGSIDDVTTEISRPSQPLFNEERQATVSAFPVREAPVAQAAPVVAWDEETFEQALEQSEVQEASKPAAEAFSFVEPVAEAPSALSSLISVEAGAQIARSFNELADVFNGVERRSIEDMAQEMLKPMLQDWLEDNLPTLVERLVREEIERVARGPRR